MRFLTPCIAACSLLAASASAQIPDSGYATLAFTRWLARLSADSSLPDSLRHLDPERLSNLMGGEVFRRLPDSLAGSFAGVLAATFHDLPDSSCAARTGARAPGSISPGGLAGLNPSTIDRWLAATDVLLHAPVGSWPPRPVASPAETQAVMLSFLVNLPVSDKQRLAAIAREVPRSPEATCWFTRLLMDRMAQLPPDSLGPIVRGIFGRRGGPPL